MKTIAAPQTAARSATKIVADFQYIFAQYFHPNFGTGLSRACALMRIRVSRLRPACRGSLHESDDDSVPDVSCDEDEDKRRGSIESVESVAVSGVLSSEVRPEGISGTGIVPFVRAVGEEARAWERLCAPVSVSRLGRPVPSSE